MRTLVAVLATLGLAAGAVALDAASPDRAAAAGLETFDSCEEVEDWFRTGVEQIAVATVGDGAMDVTTAAGGDDAFDATAGSGAAGGGAPTEERATSSEAAPAPAADAVGGVGGGGEAEQYSGTNLQEGSVDEPDVVKTDGSLLVTATMGVLHVVDAGSREELATLDLPGDPSGEELLLRGDRVLVIARTWRQTEPMPRPIDPGIGGPAGGGMATDMMVMGEDITRLTTIDLSDPAAPTVTATAELDGGYVSARMTASTVRVVLQQWAAVADPATATASDWLPSIAIDGADPAPLAACDDVSHTSGRPTSTGTTSVVTFDADGSLEPTDTDVVAAAASTIYASSDRLYVGSQSWDEAGPGGTDLHAFDTTQDRTTDYVGSAGVAGWLLSQWSLSEAGGVLRVASSTDTDSRITVLRETADGLTEVGLVTGLGPSERIYAVRYIGDLAFVVTFRQTDPLYTIDLSDPENPRTLGELKVTGFSSYLHPVGDDRLLGVGQEATGQGMTTGTQVSLFDVSDLAAPTLVDKLVVPGAHSPVEHDHKAFTWWAETSTAVVPFERYDERSQESGALVLAVDAGSVSERGRLSHTGRPGVPQQWPTAIQRSIVIGSTLWTLSEGGLLASDLDSLADRAWIDFPDPPSDMGIGIGGTEPGVIRPMPMPVPEPGVEIDPLPTPETTPDATP